MLQFLRINDVVLTTVNWLDIAKLSFSNLYGDVILFTNKNVAAWRTIDLVMEWYYANWLRYWLFAVGIRK